MVKPWKMLTLVGEDQPGIVAQITHVLFAQGWTLGETSMMRIGGSFTIMMMVSGEQDSGQLIEQLTPATEQLGLHLHVDEIAGGLHQHRYPNYMVRVVGADRAGIVAQVTGILAESDFNILELTSDVAGSEEVPVYIMTIEGYSAAALEELEQALNGLQDDIDVSVKPIETLFG